MSTAIVGVVILPRDRDLRFTTVRRGGTLIDSDHRLLALWAADCAEHVLQFFESVQPSDGFIRICGFDLRTDPVEAKKRLAFMPDEPRLFDYLTVEEHIRFVARLYQVADVDARLTPLLEEFPHMSLVLRPTRSRPRVPVGSATSCRMRFASWFSTISGYAMRSGWSVFDC